MEEKRLGKITHAEFGQYPERPFLFGLQLCFETQCYSVCDGGHYTVNISPMCKWTELERSQAIVKLIEQINKILNDAKVYSVSELKNKPVELIIENNTFKSFRILTEVI